MSDPRTPQDRLQPALLDRLTDDEPDKKLEPREQRVLSKSKMRRAVLRDLAWLFNATRPETSVDFPAPFGPMMPTTSPVWISSDRSLSAQNVSCETDAALPRPTARSRRNGSVNVPASESRSVL